MVSLKSGRTLTIIIVAVLIVGAVGAAYLVYESQLPARAALLPNVVVISAGQQASLEVSWVGGALPYSVGLYSSPTSACTASSAPAGTKTELSSPSATFIVEPTTTTYYCATVVGVGASSAVSAVAVVMVRPALTTPSLVISPSGIDTGQTATLTVTLNWVGGASPYTVTLYTGSNSSCILDTTKATVVAGSNPLSSLVGTTASFLVKDPVSTKYYCGTVTDSSTNSHSVTSPTEPFNVNLALSAAISPSYPIVDSGQPATLTAVPTHGTAPYSYQWYTGTDCVAGAQITGGTTSALTTGPLTSTLVYSVYVTDGSPGTPQASACASVIGAVSQAFTGTSVVVSPSGVILDSGQSESLMVTWSPVGTLPYTAQLYSSSTPSCSGKTAVGLPHVLSVSTVNFTVSPTSNTYYCATVKDGAIVPESAASPGTLVTVNSALAPTTSLSLSAIDAGQTATITATVTWAGGTPTYSVTLYSGTSTSCTSDTTKVGTPKTGITGTSTTFTFAAPAVATQYCAGVTDAATAKETGLSATTQFTINKVLTASISPATPVVDNGSSITLTAVPSGGTSSFSYQWYTGSTCASGSAISGQTSSSYTTGAITSPGSFSVNVTDGSKGTPGAHYCAYDTLTVSPSLGPSLVFSSSAIDVGQTAVVTATVTWAGGTSPYTVTLFTTTSGTCTSGTTTVGTPKTGVAGTSAIFTFTPTTTALAVTEYCASVQDSAAVKVTAYSSVLSFTVNPAMTTPSLALSLPAIDVGQTAVVTATVTWAGGTSPYTVTLFSGTSSACSSDTTMVAVLPDGNPQSDLTAVSTIFSFNAPVSTTYYCAVVTDGSVVPVSATTSPAGSFTVNPVLQLTVSPLSESVDSGQPFAVTLTALPSQGTSPYSYQWYKGSACTSGSAISGQTSSSYSPGVITSTTTYSVYATDSSLGTPGAHACASSTIIVNPTLSTPVLTLSPSATTTGNTPTVTAKVTWSGGTPPYSVTLRSGLSSTCAADVTVVGTNAGVVGTSTTFSFTAPASTTYYCATMTDSAAVPIAGTTAPAVFTINPVLTATISPASPTIDSGQSIPLTATPSNGVSPYTYQWYVDSTCSAAISGATTFSYAPSPLSTTSYSVEVTDSSTPTPNTACVTTTVTVNAAFTGTTVTVSPPAALDVGQSAKLTVSWSSAGTPTYTVYLTTSLTTTCSSPSPFESQTAISGTSVSFTVTPTSSTYYCAQVTDSAHTPESTLSTAADLVSVSSTTLSIPTIALYPTMVDTGQTATVTATVTWSGGTSPYTVLLESGPSSSCASDTNVVSVSGSNPKSGLAGPSTNFSFVFSGSATTYYCAKVTDGATTPVFTTSSSAVFTVNHALTATISPATPTIDSEQSVVLTVSASGGTPAYSYLWYTGSACVDPIPGETSSSYSTPALAITSSFSVLVNDSSPGSPGAHYCAGVTVTVNPVLTATITPASPTIDSGQFITLTVTPSGGTPFYFYTWYSGTGCTGAALVNDTSASLFTGPLTGTTTYSVNVTDNSIGTPGAHYCAYVTVTVNSALVGSVISVAPTSVVTGGSSTLSTTASFIGGTSTYACQWLVEAPGATSFSDLGASFSCTTSLYSVSTGTLGTVGIWQFEFEVTDSSAVANSAISNVVGVDVTAS